MDAREDIPRVSVGSVQDWEKLKTNYRNATIASLEERMLANGLADERDMLIMYTNEFIDRTFHIAQPNLRINGQNYELLNHNEQNMEPFDEALDRRIWSLAATRLQWQKRIAEMRRNLPLEIEATVLDLMKEYKTMEDTASVLEDYNQEEPSKQSSRYSRTVDGFQALLALGEELDQTMPTQEERAQRIRNVAAEIKTMHT